MAELETLKWEIENNKLSSNYWVFQRNPGSEFVVEQYVRSISTLLNKKIAYIDNLSVFRSDMFGTRLADASTLYVYCTDEYDLSTSPSGDCCLIVIAQKTSVDCYTFCNPTEEQLVDYVLSVCDGVDPYELKQLVALCKNPYRIENEVEKIILFDKVYRNTLYNLCKKDNFLADLSNSNIFDFTDALMKNDRQKLLAVYKKLQASDVEPLGVVTILYRAFKDAIKVKGSARPTPESTGLKSEKQIYAISKSLSQFSPQDILSIFKMLCKIDYQLKTGYLPSNLILDYVVTYILCRC